MFKKEYIDEDLLTAYDSLLKSHEFLNHFSERNLENFKNLNTDLILNILVDGHDPLESSIKSLVIYLIDNGIVDKQHDINKCLALKAPFTYCARISTSEVVINDVIIPKNSRVMCMLAVKTTEDNAMGVPFGAGKHRCIGEGITRHILGLIWDNVQKIVQNYHLTYHDLKENNFFGIYMITSAKLSCTSRG